MSEDLVLLDRPKPGLAVVTFNRPAAKNALSQALRARFVAIMALLQGESVDVVILTGAGSAFCAGLDLKEMSTDISGVISLEAQDPVAAIENFPGIVIGAINGPAVTGGFELALACDALIGANTACFADTHARVGVMPGWGLSQKLSRLLGPYRAKAFSLSGRFISAQEALNWGLISELTTAGDLLEAAIRLADDMLMAQPGMLRALVALIDDGYDIALGEARQLEAARAVAFNKSLTPQVIAARRAAVQGHGHERSSASNG